MLCEDGIEMALVSDPQLSLVLRLPGGDVLGRFEIDRSELRAVARGTMTFQASDGNGHSVGMEGHKGGLKIRLEVSGHPPKICRLAREGIEEALTSLDVGV